MHRIKKEEVNALRKQLLLQPMKEETARKKLKLLKAFWDYCLGGHIIDGCNPVAEYLDSNYSGKKRSDPEVLANKEAQPQKLTDEVERAVNRYVTENIEDGRMMSIPLLNGGGILPGIGKELIWAHVLFDAADPDDARVHVRRDEILGGTHDFTRPLFRAEGHILRLRYEYLLKTYNGDKERISSFPVISAKDDPTKAITETKDLTACIRDALLRAGVKNSALASSRNRNRRVGMGTQLLQRNYKAKLIECGGESDSALMDYLQLRQINSVTGDRYRSFSSEDGQRSLRIFLDRLGRFDPPPEQKRSRKTRYKEKGEGIVKMDRAGPLHCNLLSEKRKMKKGDSLCYDSCHGIDGEVCVIVDGETTDSENWEVVDLY